MDRQLSDKQEKIALQLAELKKEEEHMRRLRANLLQVETLLLLLLASTCQ